jgi:dihydrofolate synthase/folylpolyglutamate synthase
VQTDLNSLYQIKNVRTVLCAIERLKEQGLDINEEFIKKGLSQTKKITGLSGRWDVIQKNPSLILEVAHNEDGIRAMLEQVAVQPFENLHFVIGVVKDKDVQKILTLLPKNASYYFTQASIPRALIAMQLLEQAKKAGLEGAIYENVNSAIKKAKEQASTNDGIIVCGSIFLIAEVDRKQFTTV